MTSTTDTTGEVLKQDSRGRVRTPRVRREVLLGEFERSGMSGREFAAFSGVKYQTFATWVQQRRKGGGASGGQAIGRPVRWMEAVVEGKPEEVVGKVLVVELGGGARMEVRDEAGAKLAAEVLRHLGGARAC